MVCDEHSLIADVALIADGEVLLVLYGDANRYDHQAGWFLPDDAIRDREHPDAAAKRIAREQLGLRLAGARLHHVESFTGNNGSWHIPFHYVAELNRVPTLKPSEDLVAAEWFDLGKLPVESGVAHHGWALQVLARIANAR